MNQPESKHDIGNTLPMSKFYTMSPGQNNNDRDAWKLLFGDNPGDTIMDAGEIAYFADHPALLSRTMARDLVELQTQGPSCVHKDWMIWSMSPLVQPSRYYRLFAAMVPTCPVNFEVFVKLRNAVVGGHLSDFDMLFDAAREELAVFELWLYLTNWTDPDDDETSLKRRSATSDDVKRAYDVIVERGDNPTKDRITEVLRNLGLTIGGSRAHKLKRDIEKQSAVRPPDCAD